MELVKSQTSLVPQSHQEYLENELESGEWEVKISVCGVLILVCSKCVCVALSSYTSLVGVSGCLGDEQLLLSGLCFSPYGVGQGRG